MIRPTMCQVCLCFFLLNIPSKVWPQSSNSDRYLDSYRKKLGFAKYLRERQADPRPEKQYYPFKKKVEKEERYPSPPRRVESETTQKVAGVKGLEANQRDLGAWVQQEQNSLDAKRRAQELADELSRALKQTTDSDPYSVAVHDSVTHHWFSNWKMRQNHKTVFLAFGNPIDPLSPEEAEQVFKVAQDFYQNGYWIFYDNDSMAASVVREAVPSEFCMGISGQWKSSSQDVIGVSNPFLRMELLLSFRQIVMSPNSILGLGLLMEGYAKFDTTFSVLDLSGQWRAKGLSSWSDQIREDKINLGVQYSEYKKPGVQYSEYKKPGVYQNSEDLLNGVAGKLSLGLSPFLDRTKNLPRSNLLGEIQAMKPSELTQIRDWAQTFTSTSLAILKAKSGYSHSVKEVVKEAVLFGSGSGSPLFESLVSDVSTALAKQGISMTTGGAKGFMKTANRAAFKAGGLSVGIPMGGAFRIVSELTVSSQYHHYTFSVPGYSMRIPLLLQGRDLVLVAPGGSGTMKELATTWVMIAAEQNPKLIPEVIFLGRGYYDSLLSWIQSLPFSSTYLHRIRLVDSLDDLPVETQVLETQGVENDGTHSASGDL